MLTDRDWSNYSVSHDRFRYWQWHGQCLTHVRSQVSCIQSCTTLTIDRRILLNLVQGPISSNANTSVYGDLFPLTSWPMFEILFKSSLVVVIMALALHISVCNTVLHKFGPEIERIMYSLQFMFADSVTPLLVDYRTKRLVSTTIHALFSAHTQCYYANHSSQNDMSHRIYAHG